MTPNRRLSAPASGDPRVLEKYRALTGT